MIRHHPSEENLLALAAGSLAPGLALVMRAHLETCAVCRTGVSELEAAGGTLFADLEPVTLDMHAFANVLARLDKPVSASAQSAAPVHAGLPAALAGCELGRWLWIGPGVRYRGVRLAWAPEANVMLLRVAANRRVIHHSHGGAEFTQILSGGFTDETGDYGPGDIEEADATTLHQPHAGPKGCLCLAALEGGLRLPWLGRLFRGRKAI